jgi:type II secretory pathway predicted ATPase ExeA
VPVKEESFFKFQRRPFRTVPCADHYVPTPPMEVALQSVERCLERDEGVALVTGRAGIGKSMLCRVLADKLRGNFRVAMPLIARLGGRRELLQAVAYGLGLEYRGLDEGELRLALVDRLMEPRAASSGVAIILDEAHSLPFSVLHEARLLTNIARSGDTCVRLVLVGLPLLEERLTSPKVESLSQQIATRAYLAALDRAQALEYVRVQVENAGGACDRLFATGAVEAAYDATEGVPRLLNQLLDQASGLARDRGRRQITATIVEDAWANHQQLPVTWSDRVRATPIANESEGILEFGALDDFDRTLPRAGTTIGLAVSAIRPAEGAERDDFDEEFRPIGTIGPVAHVAHNPFAEHFMDEELLLDRYAESGAFPWCGLQQVISKEGRALSALLNPILEVTDRESKLPTTSESHAEMVVEGDPPAAAPDANAPADEPITKAQPVAKVLERLRRA